MPSFKLRRMNSQDSKYSKQMAELRKTMLHAGDSLNGKGRELTKKLFGSVMSPTHMVERICADIKKDGLSAVLKFTLQLDKIKMTPDAVRVPAEKLAAAHKAADNEFLDTLRNVRQNILSFQMGVLHTDAVLTVSGSHELQLRYRPLRRIGVCMPGGTAMYPSSLLMTVVPAQAAGVSEIVVMIPPTANGADHQDLLAACHELGVKEVYRIGGAQAVAALAYGIDGLEPVDMIVGRGNQFASLAKRCVSGTVAIDCVGGPTELIIIADSFGKPEFIASDLIAHAEQSPSMALLVTWGDTIPDAVSAAINKQLAKHPRAAAVKDALTRYGAIIRVPDGNAAVTIVNELAPEILHIQTRDPDSIAEKIVHAGAIFLGHFTPVALGDYAAGPSLVLPTGTTARFASGLTANDFMRRTSLLSFTQRGVRVVAEDVNRLAQKEGRNGHITSMTLRVNDHPTPRPPKKMNKSDTIVKARR
jgi:histidinol dehydrogenase